MKDFEKVESKVHENEDFINTQFVTCVLKNCRLESCMVSRSVLTDCRTTVDCIFDDCYIDGRKVEFESRPKTFGEIAEDAKGDS